MKSIFRHVNSLLVLQNFTTARKRGNIILTSCKLFSSDTHQSIKAHQCRCEARYIGRTMQRLADRIQQHFHTSIRIKSSTLREQPPLLCVMCKNISSKSNCQSAIGQHLIAIPECAKTYTDDNFRIIGQARSSLYLGALESVYIRTQKPVLCRQKEFVFYLKLFT